MLKIWFIEKKVKPRDFAPLVGISMRYLYHIMAGRYKPGIHLCRRIENHTGGDVTDKDWGIVSKERKKRTPKPKVKQLDIKDIMDWHDRFESLARYD